MEATQQLHRPANLMVANGAPIYILEGRTLRKWDPFPAMKRPIGWHPSLLDNRDGPLKKLAMVPATRPWTERDDQYLFDASLKGENIPQMAEALGRGYAETRYRIAAHSNATFIDSKLPEHWMRPYFTVLNELRRSGQIETPWTDEEEEELMLFVINGSQWIDPLVFADDRTAEGTRWRMKFVTGPVEPYKSRFEALKRREERELKEFQDGMSDQEWMELGLPPRVRRAAEGETGNGGEARTGGPQGARTGWRDEVGEHGVVVVLDD